MNESRSLRRAALTLFALLLTSAVAAEEALRDVVLVTIDTLRADHLGCYGYDRPTSPFLDRLAREGVLFENAYASSSMTAPSHASLFTGLYPPQHGVRSNDQGFADRSDRRFPTLAEILAADGWTTAAFSAVGFLRPISGGFQTVDTGSGDYHRYRQADATVDRALRWLGERRSGERLFLWLHLFDPHPPRRTPSHGPPRLAFASPAEAERFAQEAVDRGGVAPGAYRTPLALADDYAQYDAEIAFADSEVRRLFERMEALHLNEHALWVVTADHGEGLGNHDWLDHVRFLYNEAIHVPLLVYANHRWAGMRVPDLVRLVDVAPTVLDALRLSNPYADETPMGRSLLPVLHGQRQPPAMAFSIRRPWRPDHPDWEGGEVFALQDLDWKCVVHTEGNDEFFDLRKDPLEARSLADQASPVRDRFCQRARELFAVLQAEGRPGPSQVDHALTEELKALGYVR